MKKAFVIYQGVRMIKGWPEKIEAAQLQLTVTVAGQDRQRVRYGQEADDWAQTGSPAMIAVFSRASFMFLVAMLSVVQFAVVK